MFLSILTLLQSKLPCSVNYYRYKNNYEKYVGDGGDEQKPNAPKQGDVIKTIASPVLMKKLSPVATFIKEQGINVQPVAQNSLLKYALNKEEKKRPADSDSDDEQDFSKFGSKKLEA